MVKSRLTKSRTDQVIDGVCGGIADYFNVDPVIIRLIFVVFIFLDGFGIILYIILAIIMPRDEKQLPKDTIQENVMEMGERIKDAGEKFSNALSMEGREQRSKHFRWFGLFLILLGLYFLLKNLNMLNWFNKWVNMDLFWPLILIFIGAWMLISRLRG